nr:hypothetical protein [Bacteroidota bacterium]
HLIWTVSFLFATAISWAQEGLHGTIEYPKLGISFTVPDGWQAHESEGLVYFGSESVPGLILMRIHELKTMDELRASLDAGFSEDGIELFSTGAAGAIGEHLASIEYNGKIENESAKGLGFGMLDPNGNGVSIIALALEKFYSEKLRSAATSLMESVTFKKVEYDGPSVEHWKRHLTNSRLTRIENYSSPPAIEGGGGGYGRRQQIDLCADGFTMMVFAEVAATAGTVSGNSSGSEKITGKWGIAEGLSGRPVIHLDHSNGARSEFQLDEQEGKVFLNGERWFRTVTEEHSPECD